jgi:hypothetical protein
MDIEFECHLVNDGTNVSDCIDTVFFDNGQNEVGVKFTSSEETYFYSVNGNYNQVKSEFLTQLTGAQEGDISCSVGKYFNRLRKEQILEQTEV